MASQGILDVFKVAALPSTHRGAFAERGGKAIRATKEQGFLCFGQYKKGYPTTPLQAIFSILIDNNTADNLDILTLDVYDQQSNRVLTKKTISRKNFPQANEFCIFKLDFTPPSPNASLEFRIYYMGYAYMLADKIGVLNPAEVSAASDAELLSLLGTGVSGGTGAGVGAAAGGGKETSAGDAGVGAGSGTAPAATGKEMIYFASFSPEIINQKGAANHGGDFINGMYTPVSRGGISFTVSIDTSRPYSVEFEIEGGLAGWQLGEGNGGKVALFTVEPSDGKYWLMLQRMDVSEFDGGRFRGYFAVPDNDNPSNLITHAAFNSEYSMANWGTEPHRIKVAVNQHAYQIQIDAFQSVWGSLKDQTVPLGAKQLLFMIGNYHNLLATTHAVTRFKWFKVAYD